MLLPVLGWSDFENFVLHFPCFAKLLQDPNSQISHFNVAGHQKILTVTLQKLQKMCNRILSLRQGGSCLWYFKINLKKHIFSPCTDQKQFCPFREVQKILNKCWCIRKVSENKNKYCFKVPVIKKKWILCHARGQHFWVLN